MLRGTLQQAIPIAQISVTRDTLLFIIALPKDE
jgi:hypothetical protein